jgi:hypothetical protein
MEEGLLPAITEVIQSEYPGSIVTHWSAAIAVVTPDGTEMVVMLDRPGQSLWQSIGLSEFSSKMRDAAINSAHLDDEEY